MSIIWNVTRACCWSCKFCCVDAVFVGKEHLHNGQKDELTLFEKKSIIDKLSKYNVRIDFSGGELLTNFENLELIEYASNKIGKSNIGISISGAFLNDEIVKKLSKLVQDVEITLDCKPFQFYKSRPTGYHEFAGNALAMFSKYDVITGAQTVITKENMDCKSVKDLYEWLIENNISEWSILRFFPSGRGNKFMGLTPSHDDYCKVVAYIKEITKNSKLKIHFQYLLPNHENYTLDCRAVKKSIGILPNGDVLSCFWSLGEDAKIDNSRMKLGNLINDSFENIINSENANYWRNNCSKCVIFSKDMLEKSNG